MGLDMYLTARKPMYQYIDGEENYNKISEAVRDIVGAPKQWVFRGFKFEAMYWRKANQIHKWFVDNVQNGEDECKEHYVEREQIEALVTLCRRVLDNRELAPKLLPSQSGFFFGSTEYDEYYFQDLENTIKGLQPILDMSEEEFHQFDFYYQSSW